MRREGAVLQTFRNVHPAQAIFVQYEGRIAAVTIKTSFASSWPIIGRFVFFEIGNIDAGPFFRFPPDKFFAFAPRLAVRFRARPIVNDAAIARPTETPTVTEIILRLARIRLVHAVAAENTGVNPAAAGGRAVSFQFIVVSDLRSMMEFSLSIAFENNSVSAAGVSDPGYRFSLPAIDFREHRFDFRLALFVLRIPPI